MLNKVEKPKEHIRVGKIPENVQFTNKLVKNMNSSSYEAIRGIIEADVSDVAHPQLEKQFFKNINNLNPHKKKNINKKSKK